MLSPENRKQIAEGFRSEWVKRGLPNLHYDDQLDQFLRNLDSYADALATSKPATSNKERRRAMDSTAKALGKLADALGELDRDALAWLLKHALGEGYAQIDYFNGAGDLADKIKPAVSKFHLAALCAAKDLPAHDFNARVEAAKVVKREIQGRGFTFAVAATGFAATCLAAIFEAAGLEPTSLQHWLEQAAKQN